MTMPPASSSPIEKLIEIAKPSDIAVAQSWSRRLAAEMGFGQREQWEISISVSEAATNILKFAGRGRIALRCVEGDPAFLELEALDRGVGIAEIDLAVLDGVSEGEQVTPDTAQRSGLGYGLGVIRRLMDRMSIENRPGGGVSLVARKLLAP